MYKAILLANEYSGASIFGAVTYNQLYKPLRVKLFTRIFIIQKDVETKDRQFRLNCPFSRDLKISLLANS